MDLKALRDEALKLSHKAKKAGKDAIDYSAGKLADSHLTLSSLKQLEDFIDTSTATIWKDTTTGKEKQFTRRIIIIFADIHSDFFKHMLYSLPVLSAKAFSQNIALRLADINMKDLDKKSYHITGGETLLIVENKKIIKSLDGGENIQKVVKSMSLDINSTIDTL